MCSRRGVPRQLVPGAARSLACGRERVGVFEQLPERGAQALDVSGRDDAARREPADDLAQATHVVDDGRHAGTERLEERAGLVQLGPVGEDRDGRLGQREFELGRAEIAEAPLRPVTGGAAEVVERDPRVARDEQARAGTASVARTASPRPL